MATVPILQFMKLSQSAFPPTKSYGGAAGHDLRAAYDFVIPGYGRALIRTDIAIRCPDNTYGRIASRSSLVVNNAITVLAGVLDRGKCFFQ